MDAGDGGEQARESGRRLFRYGGAVGVFAALCLLTAVITGYSTTRILHEELPPAGGVLGPIELSGSDTVLEIEIASPVADGQWTHWTGNLLNSKREFVLGFGEEFWRESGYDDGGYWTETKDDFDVRVTVPDPGSYYLEFSSEASLPGAGGSAMVEVHKAPGSSLPHMWLGVLGLIAAVGLWFWGSAKVASASADDRDSDAGPVWSL